MKKIYTLAFAAFLVHHACAGKLYVLPSAAPGGDGRAWTTAYPDLQSALAFAQSGDSILAAKGVYKPSRDTSGIAEPADPRCRTFRVKAGVRLFGGFTGGETDIAGRRPDSNRTVLSGDLGAADEASDNAYHVVTGAPGVLLDGFTVTAGYANGPADNAQSGAVFQCDGMVIANCLISDNGAMFGGAMSVVGTAPVEVVATTFTGNHSSNVGAAVNITTSTATISFQNAVFRRNGTGASGTIYASGASPLFTNCVFDSNCAASMPYVVYSDGGRPRLINCLVFGDRLYAKSADSCQIVVANSIMWGGAAVSGPSSITYSCLCFTNPGTGNITADPLFIDATAGDFGLKPGSPCIDKAGGALAPPLDFNGRPRWDYPSIANADSFYTDMGPFECTQANLPPVITGARMSGGIIGETITVALDSLAVADPDNAYPRDFILIVGTGAFTRVTTTATFTVIRPSSADTGGMLSIPVRVRDLIDTSAEYVIRVPVRRRVVYVDASATGLNNGSSWKNAYPNLLMAMQIAPATSEIWVAKGTYLPVLSDTIKARSSTFELSSATAPLYGGFAGIETERRQRNWRINETILSGDIGRPGDSTDNCFHVVTATAAKIIDGFVVTGGNADSVTPETSSPKYAFSCGGGMLVNGAAPTVGNCTFRRNSGLGGGAIYNYQTGIYKITNCVFCYNSATDTAPGELGKRRGGGAIFNYWSSNPTVTNCVFYRNSITANGWGAAVYHYWGGIMPIVNSTFFNNSDAANTRTGLAVEWATRADVANSIIINTSVGNLDNRGPTAFSYSCLPPGTTMSGTGNIFVVPKFVDTAAGDFHLTTGSLCIDQASGALAPALDIEGNARWDHPACDNADNHFADIGAFEYRPTATDAKPSARPAPLLREEGLKLTVIPAGASVCISFSLPDGSAAHGVRFWLFDARGVCLAYREIRAPSGSRAFLLPAAGGKAAQAGGGVYFCKIESGPLTLVKKIFLTR